MGHRRNFHHVDTPSIIIIPMIDIMLFLLVFFMISTIFMVQLNTLPVNLPQAAAVQRETKPNIVSITVDQDGKITYGMDKTPSELASSRVKEDLGKDPESVFVIRGDRKASYESIAQVLDVLKASGAKHVSLASEVKSRS